jgi:hypothetical protein
MEAGVLTFTPEEYQILEDIEFDETIERPETIRFYTLDEQTTDAYEKLMPKGRTTRFVRDKIRKEVDRLQDLYETYVAVLPEAYALREPEVAASYTWVNPVYTTNDTRPYVWDTQWRPLYENLRQPNFLTGMLAALPHPYVDAGQGVATYPLTTPTTFVDEAGKDPLQGLPDYLIPRTQLHSDRTISIVLDPAAGTADAIGFKGYFLRKRPLDLPNPLPEHPFLKENADTFVPTSAPLKDVVPSLDAILTHAVPVTKDPYGEATPYLKLWDVKLASIPWTTWKSKFPPVDPVEGKEPAAPIEFPKPAQLAVPEKIQDSYGMKYEPGISVRLWLMKRIDGGGLVVDLLRSMAIDNGSVNIVPGVDLPKAAYPETTIEACSIAGKPFPEFATTGILRRTFVGDKAKYQCVPLEFIKQERGRAGYIDRLPWTETTGETMKKTYMKRLSDVTPPKEIAVKEPALAKTPQRPDSIRRVEVLAVLTDPERYAEDKLRDVRELLQETTVTNNVYVDTEGSLVACGHTLSLLSGDLTTNRQAYYEKWTARLDGFRVCKFCGEQINSDVFVSADEYDEDGFLVRNEEALQGPGHGSTGVADYVTGLRKLQPLFMLNTPHDDTVFLVLSLLQVLPTADVLEQFLGLGRQVAAVQFTKGSPDQIARFQGMTGLATAALILQCHVPSLIPRRSFGPRPLILSGYPRDAAAPAEFNIVDTLIGVLRKTFEAFPTTFGGPAKAVVRGIMNKPGEVKNTVIALLSPKSPLLVRKKPDGKMEQTFVAELLIKAKAYAAEKPPVEVPKTLIPVMAPPKEFDVIKSYPACPSARPVWTSGRMPRVTQPDVPLRNSIQAAKGAEPIAPAVSERVDTAPIEKAQIRARLATGSKLTSRIKVGDETRTNLLLASRLADLFRQPTPLRAVDPSQNAAELRDIARGFAMEQLADIQAVTAKQTRLEEIRTKDVALYMLQADYKEEKAQANKLRATERLTIVEDLKKKSDTERELIQQLLSIGAAPYLVSRNDREMFAREAERLQEMVKAEEEEMTRDEEADAEVGVGLARDYEDDGDEDERGVDHGDYGDRAGLPEGRDYPAQGLAETGPRAI